MGKRLIKPRAVPKLLALLVLQQSLFLAAGVGLWLWSGRALGDFLRFSWADLLLGGGLAAGLMLLLGSVSLLRPALIERLVREQGALLFSTERPYGAAAILIISLSAGIGEEALFRGGLQNLLGAWVPAWAAILIATALFAVAHPGSIVFMSFVAVLSLAFGLAYHWSESLLAVMIAHALFDVFACLWVQHELRRLGHWDVDA